MADKTELMSPREQTVAGLGKLMDGVYRDSLKVVSRVLDGSHPEAHEAWKDSSAQVRGAFVLAQAAGNSLKNAVGAPSALSVVVVAQRQSDFDAWEAQAAAVEQAGRGVIDVPFRDEAGRLLSEVVSTREEIEAAEEEELVNAR